MPDDPSLPKSGAAPATPVAPRDPKAERLAEALRANLKRRKAADRARRDKAAADSLPDETP